MQDFHFCFCLIYNKQYTHFVREYDLLKNRQAALSLFWVLFLEPW